MPTSITICKISRLILSQVRSVETIRWQNQEHCVYKINNHKSDIEFYDTAKSKNFPISIYFNLPDNSVNNIAIMGNQTDPQTHH